MQPASRAKSCTRCRQAKVACDARKTLNGPCSRCRSRGLDCRFDAHFKRVSTRRLTEEITNELHTMHSLEKTNHVPAGIPPFDVNTQDPSSKFTSITVPSDPMLGESISWLGPSHNDAIWVYKLGDLKVEDHDVKNLFQHFDTNYRPYAIFLEPSFLPSDLFKESPLLFWIIILVSNQEIQSFPDLYLKLMPEVEKLLAQILYKAIDHIKTIHALLLLCLWPIPQPQYLQNPAWNYIGLAINAAMQLHCHTLSEPDTEEGEWRGFAPTTDSKVTNETKSRTWLGCVKVGTLVALVLGMPMPISTQQHMRSIDRSIETLSKSNETPDSTSPLSSTISILKIQISAMETLADVEDLNVHSKISQLFLNQLDQIHYEDSDAPHSHLLPNLDLSQAIAKLYVISMSFNLLTRDSTEDPIFQANHLKTLQESYRSATHIIHLFKNTNIEKVEDSAGYLDYQPELYLTPLLHATTILFRYLATFPSPSGEDYIHAIESMKDAHLIFQSFPKRREFIRAAIHIESLMDILKKGIPSRSMDRLVVRNKLGASVMFDAIFHACRQRNLDPRTGEPRAVREWKTVNDTFAERLPKIPIAREKDSALLSSSMDNEATVTAPYTQNPEWWEEWDKYIDLFQVGDEQMDIAF